MNQLPYTLDLNLWVNLPENKNEPTHTEFHKFQWLNGKKPYPNGMHYFLHNKYQPNENISTSLFMELSPSDLNTSSVELIKQTELEPEVHISNLVMKLADNFNKLKGYVSTDSFIPSMIEVNYAEQKVHLEYYNDNFGKVSKHSLIYVNFKNGHITDVTLEEGNKYHRKILKYDEKGNLLSLENDISRPDRLAINTIDPKDYKSAKIIRLAEFNKNGDVINLATNETAWDRNANESWGHAFQRNLNAEIILEKKDAKTLWQNFNVKYNF